MAAAWASDRQLHVRYEEGRHRAAFFFGDLP
jgi:hypothetical protein